MTVKIDVGRELTSKEIFGIYKLFCEAYSINVKDYDIDILGSKSDDMIESGIDWRPFMGAKFFGEKRDTRYEFHGYTDFPQEELEVNEERFKSLVDKFVEELTTPP